MSLRCIRGTKLPDCLDPGRGENPAGPFGGLVQGPGRNVCEVINVDDFAWSWQPNGAGKAIEAEVDSLTTEWEEYAKRSEQEYVDQFSRRRVGALLRMQMDTLHSRLVETDKFLFDKTALSKKVDGSKVFTAAVHLYRYDDGWHPSSKAGEGLKDALRVSGK